ncbi:hypothetical protein M1L60_07440 [Actinoplanes sp. TRM 88003]|uniref:Uncharacterized protein n=1 Tax=Paractinoplanes aksuensis TaxID=2939490 RepID=A0ABT1DHW8_9ACTN|nr:hypothetical protein [Actinoplanes aksuensis]MCO8270428.1 hypothetical protein [Actinoplanes aksuensis]
MRRLSLVVASVLATALVAAGTPGIAQAAGVGQILIGNNHLNPGVVDVSIDSEEPVASIHIDFVNRENGQVGGSVDAFDHTGEAPFPTRQLYTTSSPVVMAPGDYDAEVAVTDVDGEVTRHSDFFRYFVVAEVHALEVTPPTIDYDHRDITVTGKVLGRQPGTGELRPIPGATVQAWVHMSSDDPIVTGPDGAFEAHFTMAGTINTMEFSYGEGAPYTRAAPYVNGSVTVTKQPTRATIRPDKRRVRAGETITLTGKVERRSATGWVPAPTNSDLYILADCDDTGCLGTHYPVLAPDGTFRVEATAQRTGYFLLHNTGLADFFEGSTAQTPVVTVRP